MTEWTRPEPDMTADFTYQWNANWEEGTPILKVTKSSLSSFSWCKKKYELSYLDKRPQDTSDAMLKGTIVHNVYESLFNEVDLTKMEGQDQEGVADYLTSLLPIDDYTDTYDSIIAFESDRYITRPELFMPVINEEIFNAQWVVKADINPKYPLQRDYTIHMQGIIDRVFEEEGAIIPIELKTGIWKDAKLSPMRKEMAYYKLLMEMSDDARFGNISHWGWFYPDSNYFYVEECKKASTTALKKSFAQLIYAYENNNFPASYFYKKCVHCSFMGICDDAIEHQLLDEW
jgi:CRISPR/Cas system-associated exonuclease Cas4 (RecB family)